MAGEDERGEATLEGMAEAEEDGEEGADAQQAKGFVCMRRSDMCPQRLWKAIDTISRIALARGGFSSIVL